MFQGHGQMNGQWPGDRMNGQQPAAQMIPPLHVLPPPQATFTMMNGQLLPPPPPLTAATPRTSTPIRVDAVTEYGPTEGPYSPVSPHYQ